MAFEKGTPEQTFFDTLKKFEEETYRLDMLHKQNCAKREFARRINRASDNRNNLMETVELYDRIEKSAELQTQIESLFSSIDNQFDEYFQTILKIGAARAKINERTEICNWLTIYIKEDAPELIEERMSQKFGNEHMWKKEFSADFLKKLRTYSKSPTPELKETILRQISVLTNSYVRRSPTDKALISGDIDISEMTFEETTETVNTTREKIDDLRLLEVFAASLYDNLEKIKTRVLE